MRARRIDFAGAKHLGRVVTGHGLLLRIVRQKLQGAERDGSCLERTLKQHASCSTLKRNFSRRIYSIDCNSLPGLKRTAFPGGMDTSAPVRGLRPIPVLRGRTLKTPKPRNSMRSPFDSAFFMLSKTVSTASSALVLVMPVLLTTSLIMSSLITGGSPQSRRKHVTCRY